MMNKKVMTSALVLGLLCSMSVSYAEKELYETNDGRKNGAAVQYNFTEDSQFQVNTKLGNVTDIQLRPGEQVTYIAGGDTTRWLIDKAMVGNIQHVYIKPTVKDISTNIIINTNIRSYRLSVTENGTFDPIIRFWFRDDVKQNNKISLPSASRWSGDGRATVRNYHYKMKANKKGDASLMPEEIYDDGNKTYIRISEKNKYDMPVLYAIDPWSKKMSMVNYRVQDNWFVADKVMEKGRLLYHQKFWIDFENLKKNKMGNKVVVQDVRNGHVRKISSDDDVLSERTVYARESKNDEKDDASDNVPLRYGMGGPDGYTAEQLAQIERQGMIDEQQEYLRQERERKLLAEQESRMEKMRQQKIREANRQNQRMLNAPQRPTREQLRQELIEQREQGRLQMEQDAAIRRGEAERRAELRQQVLQQKQEQQRQVQLQQQRQVQQRPVQKKLSPYSEEYKAMLRHDLEENLEKGRRQMEEDAAVARAAREYRATANRQALEKRQAVSQQQVVKQPAPVKVSSINNVSPVVDRQAQLRKELEDNLEQGRLQMEHDAEIRRQAAGYRSGIRQQSKPRTVAPVVSSQKVQSVKQQTPQRNVQFNNQQLAVQQQRQAQLQQQRQAQLQQQRQQQLAQQRQVQLQQQRQQQLVQQQRQAQLTAQQRQAQLQQDVRQRTLANQQRQVALQKQQLEQQRQMELRRQQLLQQVGGQQAMGGNKKSASQGAR